MLFVLTYWCRSLEQSSTSWSSQSCSTHLCCGTMLVNFICDSFIHLIVVQCVFRHLILRHVFLSEPKHKLWLILQLNCRDDNGVLVGNWSGKYKGGKPPTCWGGSQTILTKYFKNKKPVKYGQCWVFSGVFTTGE